MARAITAAMSGDSFIVLLGVLVGVVGGVGDRDHPGLARGELQATPLTRLEQPVAPQIVRLGLDVHDGADGIQGVLEWDAKVQPPRVAPAAPGIPGSGPTSPRA